MEFDGFAWLGDGKGSEGDGKRGGKRENLKLGRAAVCLHLTRGRRLLRNPGFPPHRT